MLLIVLLCLITKLALVSGDCNIPYTTLHDFDFSRFSGPRLWYALMHQGHAIERDFDCVRGTVAVPEGNRSLVTVDVYVKSEQVQRSLQGYFTNWNTSGYLELSHSLALWTGTIQVLTIDYDRYFICTHCRQETDELTVYVGYRSAHPDQETVNEVNRELQDKNIDVSQLVNWSADHCPPSESSAVGGSSGDNGVGNGTQPSAILDILDN